MIEGVLDRILVRIQGLEREAELRSLTEHIAVTSPIALDRFARQRMTNPQLEAHRLAAIQLRVITELDARLRWLASMCEDPQLDTGVRVALLGLVRDLASDVETTPAAPSEAIDLLEPAILFHALLARLRPWLPPVALALEPDCVLDMLLLGIPDYLHPVLYQRFDELWLRFHELRTASGAQVPLQLTARGLDVARLHDVVEQAHAHAAHHQLPPPPPWGCPRRSTADKPEPRARYLRAVSNG